MQIAKLYLLKKYIALEVTINLIFNKFGSMNPEKSVPRTTTFDRKAPISPNIDSYRDWLACTDTTAHGTSKEDTTIHRQ